MIPYASVSQLCAADFILNIYTSFQPKLNKCCHEVMVDNVGDRVMLAKKVVNSKQKINTFLAIKMNIFMWWLCREIRLAFLLCQQTKKVWETLPYVIFTDLSCCVKALSFLLKFWSLHILKYVVEQIFPKYTIIFIFLSLQF